MVIELLSVPYQNPGGVSPWAALLLAEAATGATTTPAAAARPIRAAMVTCRARRPAGHGQRRLCLIVVPTALSQVIRAFLIEDRPTSPMLIALRVRSVLSQPMKAAL